MQQLQERLLAVLQQSGLPAMALAYIKPDGIESAVAGLRKLGGDELVTKQDLWHIGSNGKALSATLLGLLVQDGRLGWDSSPAEIWPELASIAAPACRASLLQLLQHRAGLPPYTEDAEFAAVPPLAGSPDGMPPRLLELVLRGSGHGEPGAFRYSNAGYVIAAAMAEQATGRSFETLLSERLLLPLGIEVHWGWPGLAAGQPWGHSEDEQGQLHPDDPQGDSGLPAYLSPAGDMSFSIGDYALFVQAHLRGLLGLAPLNSAGQPAEHGLDSSLIRRLHEYEDSGSCGWGEAADAQGRPLSMHAGSAGSFLALSVISPQQGLALATVCNAGGTGAGRALEGLIKALLAEAG